VQFDLVELVVFSLTNKTSDEWCELIINYSLIINS